MKILAIISEFNPFHNGHAYLIEKAKELYDCDAVLCIMSGNFTQRGEMCLFDKYTRARHAILGGADCVIQLPAAFAVAPAEIFAKGALKILSEIPQVRALAFGCENGNKQDFINSAKSIIEENDSFKNILAEKLSLGDSYIKSYAAAFEACGGAKGLLRGPNNILGFEYSKALLRLHSEIDILPIKRIGSGFNDCELKENYSSAGAIRKNIADGKIKFNLPDYVFKDVADANVTNAFNDFLRHKLFLTDAEVFKNIYGGGEGLENRLKSLENEPLESIIDKATSKRYPSSRIRRMLCANALELYRSDCESFLGGDLYIKPLAVKKERKKELLAALSRSRYPVLTGINGNDLSNTARNCFDKDLFEQALYDMLNLKSIKNHTRFI